MNTVLSNATKMSLPAGSVGLMRSASSRTALATSRLFAVEVLTMPKPTLGSPLLRKYARRSAEASSTLATSPSRVT